MAAKKPQDTKGIPFRETISIRPSWLKAMIPVDWMKAAEALLDIQLKYTVSAEDMERYISIGAAAPVPLVVAVENFANGTWVIEIDPVSNAVHVKDANPIVLPNAGDVSRFGKPN